MVPSSADRLDSWKEIAGYLKRDVTTVQRWEKREGMPVHRHVHDKAGSVYAFRSELEAWAASRRAEDTDRTIAPTAIPAAEPVALPAARRFTFRWPRVAAAVAIMGALWALWAGVRSAGTRGDVLAGARFVPLTDFGGSEHAAALSADGRYVAFLSDRAGQMDVWVGQVGSAQFYNLTKGAAFELVNPSLRNLGFSPDGALVTFWARRFQASSQSEINVWAVPVLGGAPRPYLEGIAEFDWSSDGRQLVYHTPGPGDPTFVRAANESTAHQIFSAAPGLHAHFPIWSRDSRFIYYVQGSPPDRMDIWRIAAGGGEPERITHHDARVSHPVFVDDRTLLYLATDSHGGPWLHTIDVERRQPRRVSSGVERYTSIAASADGTRLVATLATAGSSLWRLPFGDRVDVSAGRRLPLTTVSGWSPRLGPDYLLYVASKGDGHSIWKLEGDRATELWTIAGTRVIGAPAVARDGSRIAFVAERDQRTSLYVANPDGTNARVLTNELQLLGTPAWAPDNRLITVSATVDGAPRLFSVPLDGGAPARLVDDYAVDPVWSPDGAFLVYSGADIGTTFQVKGITADGRPSPFPPIALSRGSRRLCFTPDGRSLLALGGGIGHKELSIIDLDTGRERQLSQFPPDFNVRDFDISPDGRDVVLEQLREHSDIVLIERTRR